MNLIGAANCANPNSLFNTGIPVCDLSRQKIRGLIFLDKGVTFTPTDCASAASFIAAVKAKSVLPRGQRAYPLWDLLNFIDGTPEPSAGGIGNLTTATVIINDALPVFTFGYRGSEARHRTMSNMSSFPLDVMFIDNQYAVYGTLVNGTNIGGYTVLQAYSYAAKFIVTDAVDLYHFRLTLGDITQYRENSTYVVTNAGLLAAAGLINFNLQFLSNVTNVYKIQAIADGGTDMSLLYGTQIAAATWSAIVLKTGAVIAVTSVAYDSTLNAFTVTLDSTAYTALTAGDQIQLYAPTASALATAGVKPFEGVSLIITK